MKRRSVSDENTYLLRKKAHIRQKGVKYCQYRQIITPFLVVK